MLKKRNTDSMKPPKYFSLPAGQRKQWSLRRKLLIGSIILAVIIALAIGLGVGLTIGKGSDEGEGATPTTPPSTGGNVSVPAGIWKPKVGATWTYQLQNPPNDTTLDSSNFSVWIIDLFNSDNSLIQRIQNKGSKVICYFSAGSYEDWRPDKDKFKDSDLGKQLDGWPGERWLDVSSANVRSIMATRLDMAEQKGCDGVDPDNIDGYDNKNGIGLTEDDAVSYMQFLATAAFERNLSLGLKNAGAIIPNVVSFMQWSVNEQCVQFNECETYAPFIQRGKPVFHVEYPKGDNTNNNIAVSSDLFTRYCDNQQAQGFSTIIKNMNLDAWTEPCGGTS